jgi:ankyrin repeat protein
LVELGAEVDKGVDDENVEVVDGTTALIGAAMEGRLDVVQSLLGLGASIEAVDCEGDTALLCAASRVQCLTMQFLLEHVGANL